MAGVLPAKCINSIDKIKNKCENYNIMMKIKMGKFNEIVC